MKPTPKFYLNRKKCDFDYFLANAATATVVSVYDCPDLEKRRSNHERTRT
jgi:hypothetical protein